MTRLADEVIAAADARGIERIVCASGLSPSGPIHLGNLREVMVPHFVADEIKRRGRACEHVLSWDDYDRFRKVPFGVEGIDASWAEHIGKPLTSVPAPRGSAYPNWAAHFAAAMADSLAELGVDYRGISQTVMYTSGAYRDQILLAMRERGRIDEVLGRFRTKDAEPAPDVPVDPAPGVPLAAASSTEGSGAEQEDDGSGGDGAYFPYKPYCHVCETDFTQVTAYDDAATTLTYRCTQCGHMQSMDLSREDHGKLVWKVDWPMRWAYEGVLFEPSGVDHQSPGSSYAVGEFLAPIFGWERPIGPMYAFVGIAGMAKMSSSKGGVPTPADALAIMEPHVLRWLYARRRPNQGFTVAFNNEIHRLYDEWDALRRKVGGGTGQPGDNAAYLRSTSTAERELAGTPVPLAYRALCSVADLTGGVADQELRILRAMDAGVRSLADARPRLDKAATWVETQADPGDRTVVRAEPDAAALAGLGVHQRGQLALLADRLEDDWTLDGLTTLAYGIPKITATPPLDIAEKKLPAEVKADQRAFFALLYRLLLGAETGPRIPTLLLCLGPSRVRALVGH